MKLTGKCKEDFEEWYIISDCSDIEPIEYNSELNIFWNILSKSMQYGVLEDFFDSVGIRVYFQEIDMMEVTFYIMHLDGDKISWVGKKHTRPEVRIKAIEKADEIYNKRQL